MSEIPNHPALLEMITQAIEQAPQGRIPFAQYMELALYHPDHGYYSRGSEHLGFQGDFVTAPHLSPDFGELLGEQIAELWQHLGCPPAFDLVELGPGQGIMAGHLLQHLAQHYPPCLAALRYTLVETSPALRQAQAQNLQPWQAQGVPLHWCTLAQVPPATWTGCVFSNEWVDALPVHRVVLTESGLQEQYVTLGVEAAAAIADPLSPLPLVQSTLGPLSTPALQDYLQDYLTAVGIELAAPRYPLGYSTEINLAAWAAWAAIAQALGRGYLITIDYGYEASRYYAPSRREGTLQCYYRHHHHSDPFVGIGHQDITAHVDFTALQRQGDTLGMVTHGCLPQGLFLMALGLGDRLSALGQPPDQGQPSLGALLQRRERLHQLINPLGLGNFQVLVQSKGLSTAEQQLPLRGLTLPADRATPT